MTYAIYTENLKKSFGSVEAVKNLNLQIGQGELYALLGVNGAGKTTTIKMLSCLLPVDSGRAEVMGHSITENPMKVKEVLNVSPQESSVAPNLTVYENLAFIAQIYGFSKVEARIKADEIIGKLSLQDVKNTKAKTLSGGYARRLSIAMSLITEPKVLFLDEPTLGLDVLSRRELWKIIRELKGKITIVLTTHYLEEAEALADKVGIMSKGVLMAQGTAEQLKALAGKDEFEEAFISIVSGEFPAKDGACCEKGGTI